MARLVTLCLLLWAGRLPAAPDSLFLAAGTAADNKLTYDFTKQLNTFGLFSTLRYTAGAGPLQVTLRENFNSSFLRISEPNIKDEHGGSLRASYAVLPGITLGTYLRSTYFSDSRKTEINSASVHDLLLFAEYSPSRSLVLLPFAGYAINQQTGERDGGMLYGVQSTAAGEVIPELLVNGTVSLYNEDIAPRRNSQRAVTLSASSSLPGILSNLFTISFDRNAKDFYFSADSATAEEFSVRNNIQTRGERYLRAANTLETSALIEGALLQLHADVEARTVDKSYRYKRIDQGATPLLDTRVEEIKYFFEGSARFLHSAGSTWARFSAAEREERNSVLPFGALNPIFYADREGSERRKNNISQRFMLVVSGSYELSSNDRIQFNALSNKLKYDTPSQDNFDDRDELLLLFKLRYSRRISMLFEAFTTLEGNYNHLAYISAQRSSNNNVNRILKLNLGGAYTGKHFSNTSVFEVSANYTVYDFEDIVPNYKSYSFRQFYLYDSARAVLGENLSAHLNGYIKLSEQGELQWKAFASLPLRYLEEILFIPSLQAVTGRFGFTLGIRHFSLKTFTYKGKNRITDSYYSSTGPLADIRYEAGQNIQLRCNGWYEFIKYRKDDAGESGNIFLTLAWNI